MIIPVVSTMWNPGPVVGMSVLALCALPAAPDTQGAPGWRVELRSSGGISGRGVGGVAVQSDGAVVLMRFGMTRDRGHAWEPTCTLQLPDQVRHVAAALESTQPETWRERSPASSKPDGCCDTFQWELEVIRTAADGPPVRQRTSWISERASDLPADVNRLRAVLIEVWNAAKPSCGAEGPVDR
jgi:hypothetical protein